MKKITKERIEAVTRISPATAAVLKEYANKKAINIDGTMFIEKHGKTYIRVSVCDKTFIYSRNAFENLVNNVIRATMGWTFLHKNEKEKTQKACAIAHILGVRTGVKYPQAEEPKTLNVRYAEFLRQKWAKDRADFYRRLNRLLSATSLKELEELDDDEEDEEDFDIF